MTRRQRINLDLLAEFNRGTLRARLAYNDLTSGPAHQPNPRDYSKKEADK